MEAVLCTGTALRVGGTARAVEEFPLVVESWREGASSVVPGHEHAQGWQTGSSGDLEGLSWKAAKELSDEREGKPWSSVRRKLVALQAGLLGPWAS